ncbi:MAG: type VI secretion system contractile sheath large subunit [bacterium]
MTRDESRTHVEIAAETSPSRTDAERPDDTFRILILGDFGGGAAERRPVGQRAVQRIDRDGIDAAIDAIAPALLLSIDPDARAELIDFRELDDFHADRLLEHVPALARLRQLRVAVESRLATPARADAPASPEQAGSPTAGSLLDRILENQPALPAGAPPEPTPRGGDDLSDFVRRAVRPHLASEPDPPQRARVALVDAALAAALRALLHHPEFQALEAVWRAVDFFARRCDAGDSTAIGLLDLTRAELSLAAGGGGSTLRTALGDALSGGDGAPRWSLVIAAYQFEPADIGLLAHVAAVAAEMGVPWLAAADPRFAGTGTFVDGGDMDAWDASPAAGWNDLRHAPDSRYLCLALPRFLVRAPYGAENPIESMTFEEFPTAPPTHDSLLWANPAFLCALVASTPVERGGTAPSQGTVGGMPLHPVTTGGNTEALPCAEVVLSQRAAMHLLGRGLTPLMSQRNGDAVRIARLQSIADPPVPLPIRPATGS